MKDYYELAKPRMVYGNIFTTAAAFLFACHWKLGSADVLLLFLAVMIGLALVIASACAFNNYLDRHIDRAMARTRMRGLVTGTISPRSALVFASVLGVLGFILLAEWVNLRAASIALSGFIFYVVFYGAAKRASHWGAVVGSVSGAVPIVVGYVAVTDAFDPAAVMLFLILILWQMPHFYAIAIRRFDEYAAAGIPTLPARKGIHAAKIQIVAYIAVFVGATVSLSVLGYCGYVYLVAVLLADVWWFCHALSGFWTADDTAWARNSFRISLVVLLVFSVALAVSPLIF